MTHRRSHGARLDASLQATLDDPLVAKRARIDTGSRSPDRGPRDRQGCLPATCSLHTWDLARATGLDETLDPDERFAACLPRWSRSTRRCARAGASGHASKFPPRPTSGPRLLRFPRPAAIKRTSMSRKEPRYVEPGWFTTQVLFNQRRRSPDSARGSVCGDSVISGRTSRKSRGE